MRDYTSTLFKRAQGYEPTGQSPARLPLGSLTRITQSFRAHWDADQAGMVVCFEIHRKEFQSYFTFDRQTRELLDVNFSIGDDAKECVQPSRVDLKALETEARTHF